MAKPLFIAEHACHARGFVGRMVAKVMAFDTAAENKRAIELLNVESARNILDFGCGHGRWLAHMSELAPLAHIVGVDASDTMVREASQRNRVAIEQDMVTVRSIKGPELPFESNRFDKLLSVHTVYFLHPLEAYLAELYRVTAAGGEFVLGFRSDGDTASFPCEVYRMRSTEEVTAIAKEAGYKVKDIKEDKARRRPMVWLVLEK